MVSFDGGILLLPVLVDKFEFVLVGLLDDVDVVVEVGAFEVDLEEDGDEDSEDQHQEYDLPGNDVGGDWAVVEGDLAHREVEVAQDYQDVLDQEQKPSYHFEVEVKLLFEGPESEDSENVDKFNNKDEVLEHGIPEEDQHQK